MPDLVKNNAGGGKRVGLVPSVKLTSGAGKSAARNNPQVTRRRGGFTAISSNETSEETGWTGLKGAASNLTTKGGPVLFWLVAGIAVCKDIIDIFTMIMDGVGVAIAASVIGAPIGAAITVLSEIIDKLSGLIIDVTVIAYFGYIGGGFALRFVIIIIGYIIDAVPILEILPITTATFFVAYLAGRALKKVVRVVDTKLGKGALKVAAVLTGGESKAIERIAKVAAK